MIILTNSLLLSLVLLIIIIIRKLCSSKLLPSVFCCIWSIFILFALIPAPLLKSPVKRDLGFTSTIETSASPQIFLSDVTNALSQDIITFNSNDSSSKVSFYNLLILIWITGIVVKFSHFIYTNLKLKKTLSSLTPTTNISLPDFCKTNAEILIIDVPSSFVYGLIQKKIVLNSALADNPKNSSLLNTILAHEYAHIKLGHLWLTFFMALVKIIYWFLPTVYLADYFMHEDLELASDCEAIRLCGCDEITYAKTFYNVLATSKTSLYSYSVLGINASQKLRKKRLTEILRFPQKRKGFSIFITAFTVTILVSLFSIMMRNIDKYSGHSESDITAAKEVVCEFYKAVKNKDTEQIVSYLHNDLINQHSSLEDVAGIYTRTGNIDLISITFEPTKAQNQVSDTLFFEVDLLVEYTENGGNGFEEGVNKDWGVWLKKDSASKQWKIIEQGH